MNEHARLIIFNKNSTLQVIFLAINENCIFQYKCLKQTSKVIPPCSFIMVCLFIREFRLRMSDINWWLSPCKSVKTINTLWLRLNYYTPKMRGHRQQKISNKMDIRHPGQLKESKSWGPFWSYQLNSTANPAHLPQNWAKLA